MALNPYDSDTGRLHALAAVTRRQFFLILGVLGGLAALFLGGIKSLSFLQPNATGEAPGLFVVDTDPSTITVDNPLQLTSQRVALVKDDGGLYAVYLVCTHLGCTPNYVANVVSDVPGASSTTAAAKGERSGSEQIPNGFKCPCHGSHYFITSGVLRGPAPRAMDWVKAGFTADGKLYVDRSHIVAYRTPGDETEPQWRLDPVTKKDNGLTYPPGL